MVPHRAKSVERVGRRREECRTIPAVPPDALHGQAAIADCFKPMPQYVLTMSCPDRTGIVAAIANFIAERNGLIMEAAHFVDAYSNRSFMRTSFSSDSLPDIAVLRDEFSLVAERFAMD